jgi:hypothetical protein
MTGKSPPAAVKESAGPAGTARAPRRESRQPLEFVPPPHHGVEWIMSHRTISASAHAQRDGREVTAIVTLNIPETGFPPECPVRVSIESKVVSPRDATADDVASFDCEVDGIAVIATALSEAVQMGRRLGSLPALPGARESFSVTEAGVDALAEEVTAEPGDDDENDLPF